MKIEKLKNTDIDVKRTFNVGTVIFAGDVISTKFIERANHKQTIKMVSPSEYIVCSTGEVKPVSEKESRAESPKRLAHTFKNIRSLISANVYQENIHCVRWCTLTYKENMQDTDRLKTHFRNFNRKLKRYIYRIDEYLHYEYITILEPQARGAYHHHLLLIFNKPPPYIPHKDFEKLWGLGFVQIKCLNSVDNLGAYLSAYLTNVEIKKPENMSEKDMLKAENIKTVEIKKDNGDKETKYYLKGDRLKFYPPKFNILRYSRGVLKPIRMKMTIGEFEKLKEQHGLIPTYQNTVKISDEEKDFSSVIQTTYYKKPFINDRKEGC